MASGVGSIEIDFGSAPGSTYAEAVVTGETAISLTSSAEAFMMAEASSDHVLGSQIAAAGLITLTCGEIVAGTGFTIYAVSDQKLNGKFKVRWIWAD